MQTTTERKRHAVKAPLTNCETFTVKINGQWANIRVWQDGDWRAIPVKHRPPRAMVSETERTVAVLAVLGAGKAAEMEAGRRALIAADPETYRAEMMRQANEALATYDARINDADQVSPVRPGESAMVWIEG